MPALSCVDRNGVVRLFDYDCRQVPLSNELTIRVITRPPLESGDFFEMRLAPIDCATLRVVMLNHFDVRPYVAAGIPDALLPAVKLLLGKNIESSPSHGDHAGVYRTPNADKVWERLRNAGQATLDADGIYRLT